VRILLDTDVLLDVALAREPFAADSTEVLRWAEAGGAAAVAWHSLINCAYLSDYRRSPVRALSPAAFIKHAAT
jgi:hypothetical protein